MQILERRAEVATERHEASLADLDITSQSDWDQVYTANMDAQMSTWARNEFHRLQHQTAKSILAST